MLTIKPEETPIREVAEGVWNLYSSKGYYVATFKSRAEAVEGSHGIEIDKIRRIKALEQICSRFPNTSLFGVG